jgi:hypothetical protein
VAYKILSSIINLRIKGFAERIIGEYQVGFRASKSTIDQLFVIRQTIEKHHEHNSELHVLFVDFKQAFDSINRERLYRTMEIMGIPQKLIRLVQMSMNTTVAHVKVNNQLSDSFRFNARVKQRDGLSTTLFILVLHRVVRNIDQ